jgi:hypothetical protein
MPTPVPASAAIAKFWADQLSVEGTKQLRIREALAASLLGRNGQPTDGSVTVDLNHMSEVAEAGYHLDAEASGTTLRVFVVDADGNEVKPEVSATAAIADYRAEAQDPE